MINKFRIARRRDNLVIQKGCNCCSPHSCSWTAIAGEFVQPELAQAELERLKKVYAFPNVSET